MLAPAGDAVTSPKDGAAAPVPVPVVTPTDDAATPLPVLAPVAIVPSPVLIAKPKPARPAPVVVPAAEALTRPALLPELPLVAAPVDAPAPTVTASAPTATEHAAPGVRTTSLVSPLTITTDAVTPDPVLAAVRPADQRTIATLVQAQRRGDDQQVRLIISRVTERPELVRALVQRCASCLAALTTIEQQVLELRAGLDGTDPRSRALVAEILGLSITQVRVIERRALRRLVRQAARDQPNVAQARGFIPDRFVADVPATVLPIVSLMNGAGAAALPQLDLRPAAEAAPVQPGKAVDGAAGRSEARADGSRKSDLGFLRLPDQNTDLLPAEPTDLMPPLIVLAIGTPLAWILGRRARGLRHH